MPQTNLTGKKKVLRSAKHKRTVFYILMVAFPVAHFLTFYVYVNIDSFLLAFREYINVDGVLSWEYSLKHFRTIFYELTHSPQNVMFAYMVKNSAIAFAVELLIVLPSSILFSFYVYKKMPFGNVFKLLLFIPSILSILALSIVYTAFANNVIPTVFKTDKLLMQLFPRRTFWTLIVFGLLISYGVNILMYVSAMSGINESIVEAAKIDGAGMFKEFIYITLPSCYSTISVFVTLTVITFFTTQINSHAFFGLGVDMELYTIGYYLFSGIQKAGTSIPQYGYLAALGLLFSLIAIPLTFLFRWALRKFGPSED